MEAKVLYSLMLDRMGLSGQRGPGQVYAIYVKNFTLPPDLEKRTPSLVPDEPPAQTSET